MITKKPIHCQKCGTFVGNEEDFMHRVIEYPGLRCPSCNTIVIHAGALYYY
jgi:DNA-directed RNA polymerase subunit RPC12/RpoP